MISTSGMVLTAVLARRFGEIWMRRWRALADEETRWLTLALVDANDRGIDLSTNEDVILTIMEGRAKLPHGQRTERSAASFLYALRAAEVWPLPEARRYTAPSALLHRPAIDEMAPEY